MEINKIFFLLGSFPHNKIPRTGLVNEWKRMAEQIQKRKTTNELFFIVNPDNFTLKDFSPAEQKKAIAFFRHFKKTLGARAIILKSKQAEQITREQLEKTGFRLSDKIKIRCFGLHAGMCVERGMGPIMENLHKQYPATAFEQKTLLRASEHSNSVKAKTMIKMIQNKRPELLFGGEETLLRMLADGGLTPRMLRTRIKRIKDIRELAKIKPRIRRGKK
jgi:hypothetical protein